MEFKPLVSFFILLIAFALYGLQHSWLASLRFKGWLGSVVGQGWMQRWYRLVYNIVGGVTLLPIFYLMAVLPNRELYVIPFPWRWLNYVAQAFGLWVLLASVWLTGVWDFAGLRQVAAADAPEPAFTTGGFYRWVRHPLYSGGMLFLWASPRMSVLSAAFYLGISLYFWVGTIYEERKLAAHFGQDYVDYAARTPMFVPRLRR